MYGAMSRHFERMLKQDKRQARRDKDSEWVENYDFLLEHENAFHMACEQCIVKAGIVEPELEVDFYGMSGAIGDGSIIEKLTKLGDWVIKNKEELKAIILFLKTLFA